MENSKANEAAAEPPLDCRVGRCCGNCRFAGDWQTVPKIRRGLAISSFVASECGYEPLPEFWKERGDRPMIYPHSGTHCRLFERKTVPNAVSPVTTKTLR